MIRLKRVFVFSMIALLIIMLNALVAQGSYSIFTGTVIGIHAHGLKKWLEVESTKDKSVVNFRIGHNTRYIPQRYPNVGERVKVEYLTQRGVPVAYAVTILSGPQ